jgi:hypothetical protein
MTGVTYYLALVAELFARLLVETRFTNPARKASALMPGMDSAMT